MKTYWFLGGPMEGQALTCSEDEDLADIFTLDGGPYDGAIYDRHGLEFHYRESEVK